MLKRLVFLTLACVLTSTAGLLVGCGQKGPLYLPAPVETPVQAPIEKPKKPEQKASTEQTITK